MKKQRPQALSICCLLLALLASVVYSETAAGWQKEKAPEATPGQVTGVFLGANQTAQKGARVLLIKAIVWDLTGQQVAKLPAKGTSIIDADRSHPFAVTNTDDAGKFEFKAVPPGRYSVGTTAKPDGKFVATDVLLLEHDSGTAVFDLKAGQALDLGKVQAKKAP